MTRLRFLYSLLGFPVAAHTLGTIVDPKNLPMPIGRWSDGRGNYEQEGNLFFELVQRCKVLIDGEDVTYGCFYFDEGNGIVGLYSRNAEGQLYTINHCEVATEWRRGKVELLIMEERKRKPIDTRGF